MSHREVSVVLNPATAQAKTLAQPAARASAPAPAGRFARPLFKSPLKGVTDAQWDAFVRAFSTRPITAESKAHGIGSFDLRPRRLVELGVMENLRRATRPPGECIADLTAKYADLGKNATRQYEVFARSMTEYDAELADLKMPEGCTRSGALAILHCGGTGALEQWPKNAFKTTSQIFKKTNGLF